VEVAGDCSFISSSWDHFWEPTCSRGPISLMKPRIKHPEKIPTKVVR
jgi:hypothetical protein